MKPKWRPLQIHEARVRAAWRKGYSHDWQQEWLYMRIPASIARRKAELATAALLRCWEQALVPLGETTHQSLAHITAFLHQSHPGTILLARHAEELAKRDERIKALEIEFHEACDSRADFVRRAYKAEAELSRAKRALRAHLEDGPDFWRRCPTCNGKWQVRPDRTESHNLVQLDGDTEPGKCPAEPEVHDV